MLHPLIKWAQRKDKVFLEVQLRDIKDQKIELKENTIDFQGTSDGQKYQFTLELYAEIDSQQSKWNKTGFHLLIVLAKKDADKPFWPRVTKESIKNQYIQVDWSKWVDEDEEQQEGDKGLSGFDPSMMQGFPGGMGGMGGMPGMGGMGMPGMGGMGMPGMGGFGEEQGEEEGNLDDLEKQEEIEEK